eukprot:4295183-Lingulodinium_polyedra.AAC.1
MTNLFAAPAEVPPGTAAAASGAAPGASPSGKASAAMSGDIESANKRRKKFDASGALSKLKPEVRGLLSSCKERAMTALQEANTT